MVSGAAALALSATAAWADGVQLALPEQQLALSLKQIARATGTNILFTPDAVEGVKARALNAQMTAREAVNALIAGTDLQMISDDSGGLIVTRKTPQRAAQVAPVKALKEIRVAQAGEPAPTSSDEPKPEGVEKVTVTGSRIRGAKQASPVATVTQDDMRRQGHTDLGQAARALPQNFAGGQNPAVALGAGGIGNQNVTGSSGINLRGIGQDGTLTLLNGTRLPYDGFTQATDVASIPVAAIARMEILLDGASAIYGSDAVGGVVNLILKRDYDGAEVSARWGEATQGGFEQQQYTGVAGAQWATGGFIATADFNRNSGVRAGQREYVTHLAPAMTIYPSSKQFGALFSGHQQIADFAELSVDAFVTTREGFELRLVSAFFGNNIVVERDATIWGIVPSLRFDLPGDWSLKLTGTIGKNEGDIRQTGVSPANTIAFVSDHCHCNDAKSATADFEGPLFDLPGGEARLAFGGGYRSNEYNDVDNPTGSTVTGGEDSSRHIYGELYLPIIGEEQGIALINRFAVSGAVRYEDYDSFGETTTPKVGAIWSVTPDIDLKATWGKSFKTPTLVQQHQDIILDLFDAGFMGGTPGAGVLFLQGGRTELQPEEAETLTAGFALHPDFLPGFNVELSWFDIDYTDRIVQPFNVFPQILIDPTRFAFVTFNPTVPQQNAAFAAAGQAVGFFPFPPSMPYDPLNNVVAIVDARYVNSAAQHVSGVDLTATYTTDLFGGSFTAFGNATWLETVEQITSLAAEKTISGYVFFPPEVRWRLGGSWTSDGLTVSATVNETGGLTNNLAPGNPNGDAFTTVDLVVDYVLPSALLGDELQLTFGVQNVFDEDPPLIAPPVPFSVNYDSTNYSPLGRVVNLTVTQRF
jgi:iron complex outermembrane receptor protein